MTIRGARTASTASIGRIEVVYDASAYKRSTAAFTRSEQSAGGTLARSFNFSHVNRVVDVLSVAPANASSAMATLRKQSGVLSVGPVGPRRHSMTAAAHYPSDPYFDGFNAGQITTAGPDQSPMPYPTPQYPVTYEGTSPVLGLQPFDENENVPGQWDMHAIKLEYAFGYSVPGGGYTSNTAALGSPSTKIAMIDTGQDTLHPELAGRITYQRCFITPTNSAGFPTGPQSTSDFTTDEWGHGTDVTGIAAASPNNGIGFVGAGGNSGIMGYRVFPTPDDSCANDNSSDPQCGADTPDIADAILDATNAGASVISLSLGGGGCVGGQDDDMTEGTAVADAIAAGVIVVAAAGNESSGNSKQPVDSPGCDPGVIAVGATGLDDGFPNGYPNGAGNGNNAGGTNSVPVEYVASYSNAGTINTVGSSTSWGIVAPGGDANLNINDNDEFHWIENIWTSTPYMSNSQDMNFTGGCTQDYPNYTLTTGTVDCRVQIEGTSQATPHVAGVVALVCAVSPSMCTPGNSNNATAMKTLLCTYADDLRIPTAPDPNQGCGRLNAYTVLAHVIGDSSPPTPIP
ncbi:MAG: S8 family serine peptidase [Vulcanimicrobiaceae bacterium]|jgi:subtilisin family serine protease